jgi:hypothetical protein
LPRKTRLGKAAPNKRRTITSNHLELLDNKLYYFTIIISGSAAQHGVWPPRHVMFLDHTQRRVRFGRIPLDKWSARRIDLYLITHNTHNNKHPWPR